MSSQPYENEISQRERREVIRNDRTTYLDFAQADADLAASGRFAATVATPVAGVPRYPALPASSPWASDPVPSEPPLGHCVDAMEPIGTDAEIERAAQLLAGEAEPAPALERGVRANQFRRRF